MKKTSCSIIVFNYESIGFLRLCIDYIEKYYNSNIEQHIIIADQSVKERELVKKEFGDKATIINMDALYSGYGLDYILNNYFIGSEYICTLDCDAFPIHKDWLSTPINLLENGFNFVGGLFFENNGQNIYPNNKFFCLTQCYRVGKTKDYKKLALNGGFSRYNVRDRGGIKYINNEWNRWGGSAGNIDSWSDDAVIAHWWEDVHCEHNKLALPITHAIGKEHGDSDWGAIMGGMVFHLGYSHWSNTIEDSIGKNYAYWKDRLNNGEDVIEEMIEIARKFPTNYNKIKWDGKTKKSEKWEED